jgi:hypothetical protein
MNEGPSRASAGWHFAVVILTAALVGMGAYSVHQHKLAKQSDDRTAQVAASLDQTNAQIQQLTAKLNELAAPKPAPVPHILPKHKAGRTHMVRMEDGRWKKIQSQIDAQGKAIDATRQDLSNTRTELQGSIARTHDELVVLEKKGERNYVEFDLNKAKQFQAEGPIGLKLRKANVKHQFADLDLLVDDKSLTKKHVNLYEPTIFYSADSDQPVELVINDISKNHIHGYVSSPKYGRGELAAMSQQGSQSANTASKPRQKLSVPQ